MPDDSVDLQRAADELGVHYQTAYRWVRTGRLPAQLVDGRYVVTVADIAAATAQRTTPAPLRAPSQKRRARAAERMHEALIAGDESTVRSLGTTLVDEGTTVVELIQQVLVPTLVHIGAEWHAGRLSIWVEHRASAIVERLLGELSPNPRGRRRGTVMVAAVSGDLHSLPTSMAAVTLRADNWNVEHLGADMPPDELVRFCAEHDVDVAVLSSTNPATAKLAAATADRIRAAGSAVVLGGRGRSLDDLVASVRSARSDAITPGV